MRILLVVFLFTFHSASGQDPEKILKRLPERQIDLKLASVEGLTFNTVNVVDLRFDTSKIGFTTTGPSKRLVTKTIFAADAKSVLNTAIIRNSSANNELWVFVRHYWLQESTTAELESNKLEQSNNVDMVTTCKVTMECFLRSDSVFTPVLRIDTVFAKVQVSGDHIGALASEPLQYMLQSMLTVKENRSRKRMTFAEVDQYTKRFYKYPRFETDNRTKGIYMSFKDFLNNQPLQREFVVEENKKTDELYIIEKGEKKILTDFWGYSDGVVCYINTGLNFFQLVSINNSYEIYGAKGLIQHTTIGGRSQTSDKSFLYKTMIGGPLVTRDRSKMEKKPLQLNMETGDLY